jgi:carbon-monoxide dehydrogenase iron sulfur subunit
MIHCDVKTCVGCRMCEVVCSSFHFEAVSPALARVRVAKLEEVGLDMAVACLSCLEKPCLQCPTHALTVSDKGVILLDAELCSGCKVCADACPIGAVGLYRDQPIFCDLCGGAISCVHACPSRSLSYSDECRDTSLEAFLASEGNPSQKRARFVEEQGKPLREIWKKGGRVDS